MTTHFIYFVGFHGICMNFWCKFQTHIVLIIWIFTHTWSFYKRKKNVFDKIKKMRKNQINSLTT
jgi:hypothetical protein